MVRNIQQLIKTAVKPLPDPSDDRLDRQTLWLTASEAGLKEGCSDFKAPIKLNIALI